MTLLTYKGVDIEIHGNVSLEVVDGKVVITPLQQHGNVVSLGELRTVPCHIGYSH